MWNELLLICRATAPPLLRLRLPCSFYKIIINHLRHILTPVRAHHKQILTNILSLLCSIGVWLSPTRWSAPLWSVVTTCTTSRSTTDSRSATRRWLLTALPLSVSALVMSSLLASAVPSPRLSASTWSVRRSSASKATSGRLSSSSEEQEQQTSQSYELNNYTHSLTLSAPLVRASEMRLWTPVSSIWSASELAHDLMPSSRNIGACFSELNHAKLERAYMGYDRQSPMPFEDHLESERRRWSETVHQYIEQGVQQGQQYCEQARSGPGQREQPNP